jgi:uncharacterized protein (DUF362 family)
MPPIDRRATVAIGQGDDRIRALRAAFQALGGIGQWVKPGHTVLLKPNMMTAMGTPTVTHVDTLRGLAELCKEAGAKRVLVGENSVCGMNTRTHFEFAGLHDALARCGCEVVYFEEDDWVYVRRDENFCLKDLHLPKSLVEADVWITVPVAKTHEATDTTLGIKNLHGVLADEDKARHHRGRPEMGSSLHEKFVDILLAAKPTLCVCDMFHAAEGQAPAFGDIVEMGLCVASADTVACDAVVEQLMGFDNLEGSLTRCAHQRGAGQGDIGYIDVVGEPIVKHRRRFRRALWRPTGNEGYGLEVYSGDVCHGGCQMLIRYIIDASKLGFQKDARELGPLYILCGLHPPPPPDDRFVVVYGDCAIYSTWHYSYRQNPRMVGPWWKPRPAYVDVPGCCPLGLQWLWRIHDLVRGYASVMSFLDGIRIYESEQYTFAKGVPPEKNPRRWHYDPAFARRYANEIRDSHPPAYVYANESIKGDTFLLWREQQRLRQGGGR